MQTQMHIPLPPPYVAAYKVVILHRAIHPKTKMPVLVSDQVQSVNTAEIKAFVELPDVYIVGWQEVHHEFFYDANAALRVKDNWVTRTHIENQVRLIKIRDGWKSLSDNPERPFTPPTIRSLEQDLLASSWTFSYAPGVGPVIPDGMPVQWFSDNPNQEMAIPIPQEAPMEPTQPASEPVSAPGQLDRLELKLDTLVSAITTLVHTLGATSVENSNASRDSEVSGDAAPSDPVHLD